jgi:alpha-1,2-mannosyltransferase
MRAGVIRGRPRPLGEPAGVARAAAVVATALIGVLAIAVCGAILYKAPEGSMDFRTGVWQPAFDIVHGRAPYPDAATWRSQDGMPSIYPPLIAVVAVPLGLLPFGVASVLWAGLLIAALVLIPWVLGVRDWRLVAAIFLLLPVIGALELGQVEILLTLAAALLWRYRDRWLLAAAALGVGLAIKPLMFPLMIWLLLTRRFRAAFAAGGIAAGLTLGSWAVIGFSGLRSYPALLQAWDRAYAACGVSISALALKLGAANVLATSLRIAVAAVLLAGAWRLARRCEGDRRSFAAAMGALVVAAPIVWSHYLMYFLVPLALAFPRLDRRWLCLAALWLIGPDGSISMRLVHIDGRVVPTAESVGSNSYGVLLGYLLVTAAVVLLTMRGRDGEEGIGAGTHVRLGDASRAGPLQPLRRWG